MSETMCLKCEVRMPVEEGYSHPTYCPSCAQIAVSELEWVIGQKDKEIARLKENAITPATIVAVADLHAEIKRLKEANNRLCTDLSNMEHQDQNLQTDIEGLCHMREQELKRLAAMSALLEEMPHDDEIRCTPYCPRCRWEKMKDEK